MNENDGLKDRASSGLSRCHSGWTGTLKCALRLVGCAIPFCRGCLSPIWLLSATG